MVICIEGLEVFQADSHGSLLSLPMARFFSAIAARMMIMVEPFRTGCPRARSLCCGYVEPDDDLTSYSERARPW